MRRIHICETERNRGKITVARDEIRIYLPDDWKLAYCQEILAMCEHFRALDLDRTFRCKGIREGQRQFKFHNWSKSMDFPWGMQVIG